MPRIAVDFKPPYNETSLTTHIRGEVKTVAACLTVVSPGKPRIRQQNIWVDGGQDKFFHETDPLFADFKAGDKIVVHGFHRAQNNGAFEITSVDGDNQGITVDGDLADEADDFIFAMADKVAATDTITVAGDQTDIFTAGQPFWAYDANENGWFTVQSSTYNIGGNLTSIVTEEDLTLDGAFSGKIKIALTNFREIRVGRYIGFTTLDQDIKFNNLTYRSLPGMDPTALQVSSSLKDDNFEINGFYHANGFTLVDVLNGVWDDAYMEIFTVNYEALGMGRWIISRGNLGQFSMKDFGYSVEYRSIIAKLEQEIGYIYQADDRYPIDHSDYGVDLTKFVETGEVTLVSANNKRFAVTIDAPATTPDHLDSGDYADYIDPATPDNPATGANWHDWWFRYGKLTFTSATNSGNEDIVFEVAKYDKITWPDDPDEGIVLVVELTKAPLFAITVGDSFSITAGYDRSFEQRKNKLDDPGGFNGEPYLPGNQAISPVIPREV